MDETISLEINPKDLRSFIFRFNARMDNGFKDNNFNKDMIDGAGLDEVSAVAYRRVSDKEEVPDGPQDSSGGDVKEEVPDPDYGINPFDPDGLPYVYDDPRLY